MTELALKVIFLDGPLAGFLWNVPDETHYWHVRIPKPVTLILPMKAESLSLLDDEATYRIHHAYYRQRGEPTLVRVGTISSETPSDELLTEVALTGLAEQGVIPWSAVPETPADLLDPIPVQAYGNPLTPCNMRIQDPFHIPLEEIDASCACGWWTERIPLARRSQLVRAAYKHVDQQGERRKAYDRPIRIVSEGGGLAEDCLGGFQFDKLAGTIHGSCRICGWRTEDVEPWRSKPLHDLWSRHAGPNGLTHARNRLLTAYGLPVPTEEEDAERFERRRQRGGIADD